jgi:predicted TIM-barrel fold metal-dependent hydrolase
MIIDFHGHTGMGLATADEMLRVMDGAGVDRACLFNIFHPTGTRSNDQTAAFCSAHPDRFSGFAFISPHVPEVDITVELRRAFDDLGMVAIKIYPPYTPWTLDDERYWPIYRFADDRGLAVISHTGQEWQAEPKYLSKVAPLFPRARFVSGHSGNSQPYRGQALDAARSYSNVYLETCSTFRTPGVIEELVSEGGEDRVLFGSDIPLMDPRSQIAKVLTADISEKAKSKVLGENALRLLRL